MTGTAWTLLVVLLVTALPVLVALAVVVIEVWGTTEGFQRSRWQRPQTHRVVFELGERPPVESLRYALSGQASAGPGTTNRSIEQLARPISAAYGSKGDRVELNAAVFSRMIANFQANTLGQEIYIDRNHRPEDGVNAVVKGLSVGADGSLLGELEWRPLGVKTFNEDGFKYFSIEYVDDYVNKETGQRHGPVLLGAALTPRPFIKNMKPSQGPGRLMLSEGRHIVVADDIPHQGETMKKAIAQLKAALEARKLSATLIGILLAQFEHQAESRKLSDEKEAELKALADEFLAAAPAATEPAAKALSESDIAGIIDNTLAARDEAARKLAQTAEQRGKLFEDTINAAQGLGEDTKKALLKSKALVLSMDEAGIKAFAEQQIALGNSLEINTRRAAMGLPVTGMPSGSVTLYDNLGGKALGLAREKFLLTGQTGPGGLRLPEEKDLPEVTRKALALFDRDNAIRLEQETRLLAGDGSVNIADGSFPVVAQRQVIVELLADLQFMQLVNLVVDGAQQSTIQIPYEVRNTSHITPGAVVYEGQPIPFAGVSQAMDTAYTVPRKIAMKITNEMLHFSRVALINWDVLARTVSSNARLMRDIICAAVANEIQRSNDSYGAVAVSSEALTAQVNGTRNKFKTAQFPVVRPLQPRDLKGTAVGTLRNGITVVLGGTPITEYDSTGTQAAGNYWKLTDPNLGYFQVVNQAGVVQTPANATTLVVSYSAATNVQKFDISGQGALDLDVYLNQLLDAVGYRKAVLKQDRLVMPEYAICSDKLHYQMTRAKRFESNSEKNGTGQNAGTLTQVEGVPFWGTNQPGTDLADARIILGQARNSSYGISKAFATGAPFEVIDPTTARPTGEKQAYGEEYSTIHTPQSLDGRTSSVLVYDATARAAV